MAQSQPDAVLNVCIKSSVLSAWARLKFKYTIIIVNTLKTNLIIFPVLYKGYKRAICGRSWKINCI